MRKKQVQSKGFNDPDISSIEYCLVCKIHTGHIEEDNVLMCSECGNINEKEGIFK